jgi:phosphoglycolate phosphatase-like HAD superfamily hydrolase
MNSSALKIFLDFDGLLVDNSLRLYTLYSDLMHEFGKKQLPLESYWNLKKDCVREEDILKRSGLEDTSLIKQYLKKRLEHIESRHYLQLNRVVEGCADILKFLAQQGETILVTTRQSRENLLWEINQKGLSPFFSKILCGFDSSLPPFEVKVKMIDEDGFLNGSRGIIIGDTEAEILCGQKLGLFTIAVTSGIRSRDYLVGMHPDRILDSINQVVESWDVILREVKGI